MEAIVLRTYPSGDSNLVLYLLSRSDGKLAAYARGARRSKQRFANTPDIFDFGQFEIGRGRGSMMLVNSFRPAGSFRKLRESLEKMSLASTLCEIFDYLLPEHCADQSAQLFDSLLSDLKELNDAESLQVTLRVFHRSLAAFLCITGYASDEIQHTAPSLKGLLRMLSTVEEAADRRLLSRAALEDVLSDFKKRSTGL